MPHEVCRTLNIIYLLKDLPKPTTSLLDKLDRHLVGDITRVKIEDAASQVYAEINKYGLYQSDIERLKTDFEDDFKKPKSELMPAFLFKKAKDDFDYI